jgi:hypothetical protein
LEPLARALICGEIVDGRVVNNRQICIMIPVFLHDLQRENRCLKRRVLLY